MDSINEYQSRINEIVHDYLRRNLSSSNTMDMLKKCEPVIVSMKESYGKTNPQYIEVSTNLAGVVLRMIVKIINDAQKSYNPYPSFYSSGSSSLTTEVGNALMVLTELRKLDLDKSFIKDRLDSNLKTLSSMASQIGAMPTCFTSIDIRTEDEYFNECETADDFRKYCKKYPQGKYKEQAISKAERIERRQKNWKRAKLIIILSLIGIIAGIIIYLIVTADDRKFNSIPKTKSGYEKYLLDYPDGKHKDESLDALYKMAESKDLSNLLEFGNKYESYTQGKKAIDRVNYVTDSLYQIANTTNTIASWDSYIRSVPSSHIKDAEQKKKAIYQALYDAAKKKNWFFLEKFSNNLSDNGTIIVDNMNLDDFWINANKDKKAEYDRVNKEFKEFVLTSDKYDATLYNDIGDGIVVIKLKK